MAYLDDLPQLVRGIAEYKALGKAADPLLESFREKIRQFPLETLPSEAQGRLLARWEKMTGLASDGDLAQRRFRLMSRLGCLRPYTLAQLKRQLAAAFGREDGFLVQLDPSAFSLSVEVDAAGQAVLADLTAELRRMIPANLLLYTGVSQAERAGVFAAAVLQVTVKHICR